VASYNKASASLVAEGTGILHARSWLARARYRIVTPDPYQFE